VRNEAIPGTTKEEQNVRRKHKLTEELKYIQSEHGDMQISNKRFINITTGQMETMNTSNLASYLAGAQILAKYSKQNRKANQRYQKITKIFNPVGKQCNKREKDKSEFDPGE
jgi:hypothetical protein